MAKALESRGDDVYGGSVRGTWAVFLISVLGLFLEMLLIRWIGTEIRIFAYLQNTVLVVCFLGLGLGCFTCRQPIVLKQMLVPLFFLVLLLAVPWTRKGLGHTSEMLSALGDLVIWHYAVSDSLAKTLFFVSLGLGLTFVLMCLLLDIFVPLGRLLGRLMDDHPHTIWAYSVNVTGSLIGTWLFVLLSVFYQPPLTWFLVLAGLTLFFLHRSGRSGKVNLALLGGIVALAWLAGQQPGSLDVIWSPYQKLVLRQPQANEWANTWLR